MNVSRPRKLLAVVAVVPLIFAGLISTAFGQLGMPSPEYQINTGKQGSITVHKYKNPTGVPAAATGKQLDDVSQLGETMNDVTFKITQLKKTQSEDFDFSKSGDIIFASQLKAEQFVDFTTGVWKSNMEGFKGKKTDTQITRDQGVATFTQLPVGVYLVQETQAPAGTVKSVPFIVAIPTTDREARNKWMYDLHVYPKNYTLDATKTVADADKHQTQDIIYTVLTDVPALKGGDEDIASYEVYDQLNTNGATATYSEDSVTKVEIIDKNQTPPTKQVQFNAQTDYTVSIENGADQQPKHGLRVKFNKTGLASLSSNSRDSEALQVRTTIKLTVAADFNKQDGIVNKAGFRTRPSSKSEVVEKPTDEVKSYFGKIKLIKTGADDQTKLSGAEFKIYKCTPQDISNVTFDDIQEQNQLFKTGSFGNNYNAGVFTTDGQGEITFPTLHVNDFADNTAVKENKAGYCVVETKAPQGYELLPKPVFVRLAKTDTVANDQTIMHQLKVKNAPSHTPKLPLTGGAGIAAIILIGAAFVGVALLWLRKRTNNA